MNISAMLKLILGVHMSRGCPDFFHVTLGAQEAVTFEGSAAAPAPKLILLLMRMC